MNKFALSLAAVALVGFTASSASAQCDFNALAKSKGIKSTVVRAFAECPSTQHPTENTATIGNTAACEPVTPKDQDSAGLSTYEFGAKGGCSIAATAKIEKDCATLTDSLGAPLGMPAGACTNVSIKGKCKGILKSDGVTPIDSDDGIWTLDTLSRATLDDPAGGDMTVVDFPVGFSFDTPKKGGLKVKGTTAEALTGLISPIAAALPTCTQIEIVRVTVVDGSGAAFARLGLGGASKDQAGPAL